MRHLYILRYLCALFWLIQVANPLHGQVSGVTAPRATLRLGTGQPFEVRTENAEGELLLRIGALRVPLPMRACTSITAETVQLKGGTSVGVVRLSAADQRAAALVTLAANGKPTAVWVGRLDFTGDPGERRADVIELGDRDADGHPDIVVGHYDERVAVCGEQHTLLAPRAMDPKTLTLRPVLLNRIPHRPATLQLEAAATTELALEPPPTLQALRPAGASSATVEHDVTALTDGDLGTYWEEGRGLGGRFEFATLSWAAPSRPIVALAIVLAPEGTRDPGQPQPARVHTLSLLGPKQEHWAVKLPAPAEPGVRYWVTLPEPLTWRCLTLAVDELSADPKPTPQTHAALAEVEAYTRLDQAADGLSQLVSELSAPGARGDEATSLLQLVRADVAGALVDAWPQLSAMGKRRALRLLFQSASQPDPRSQSVLRAALRSPDPEISAQAFKIATGKLTFGPALVDELARAATAQGDRAAQSIGSSKRSDALAVLLAILAEPGASERPALREAIATAYQTATAGESEALQTWTGSEGSQKPRAARAALALALSQVPEARQVAAQLVLELIADVESFPDQWRLVQAARNLPSEPRADGYLEGLAQRAEAWMLRSAALEALAERGAPAAEPTARRALEDEYPRVRASAVAVLSKSPGAFDLLSRKARADKWFLVRRSALDQLRDSPGARRWFLEALSDPIAVVRASALRALTRVRAVDAWPKVEPALQNAEEYPEVITEAIAFSRTLCVRESIPSLQMVATRGLKPDAWTEDQTLAFEALEALSAFGGEAAQWAHKRAKSSLIPESLQLPAATVTRQGPACAQEGPSL